MYPPCRSAEQGERLNKNGRGVRRETQEIEKVRDVTRQSVAFHQRVQCLTFMRMVFSATNMQRCFTIAICDAGLDLC